MRALVTGACGFVGPYLIKDLLSHQDEVLATVVPSMLERVKLGCATEALDITDTGACAALISKFIPDVIYHLAGISFVPEAEADFARALIVNVASVDNIYRISHMLERRITIVLISSGEVYGRVRASDLPLCETSKIQPNNHYSLTKAMAEIVPLRFMHFENIKTIVMRPFNHVGAGQNDRFVTSTFAKQLALIAKGELPPVLHVGNLEAKRDFADVQDIVRGYRLGAVKGNGVYNLCSGKSVSISNILGQLIEISGVSVSIEKDPVRIRSLEVPEVYGSYEKAEKELSWRPEIPLRKSLEAVYSYWQKKVS